MSEDRSNRLHDLLKAADKAVSLLMAEAAQEPLVKAAKEWQGIEGRWRRVGGFNLFLRDGDAVVMNGPRALRGQPVSNITADDFRAIPHVKDLYEQQGSVAVPGDDIAEVSSGVGTVTMTTDTGKAVVAKRFGAVVAQLYSGDKGRSYTFLNDRSFPVEGRTVKAETAAFEEAKAWARRQLRKGRGRG